jgi:sugar lactone lactonase YvrE
MKALFLISVFILIAAFSASFSQVSAATGDLYQADFNSGNIYKFTPNGTRSSFASGLDGPEGLAFDTAGNLFVSATGTGIIYKYAPGGTRTTFASGLDGPASLVFDGSGNLFDADFFGGVLYKFAPDGTRTTFATGLSGPANILFDSSGNLFEADFHSGNIFKFAPNGTRTTFASGVGEPHGLAFDSSGNLFVASFQGGQIFKYTPSGTRTTFATGLNGPHGIAFDASGNLFTCDFNTGNIYRFTPSGTRTTFATGLSQPANVHFEPAVTASSANNLINLSTRAFVGTGTGVLIAGFILQGSAPTTVVLRAIGPSLTAFGVNGALQDPFLEIHDAAGTILSSNDNWQNGPDAGAIQALGLAPTHALESAVRATLPAGNYTALVKGVGTQPGLTGIGLVELYDLQQSSGRSGNISTRGTVLSGENVMIAGCIIGGTQSKEIVVRGIGPSLRDSGVGDALANPRLQLFNSNGVSLAANDDWQQGPDASSIQSHGLAPSSTLEAALLATLAPGSYTAIESPASNESGVGLIEIYDLSPFNPPAQPVLDTL